MLLGKVILSKIVHWESYDENIQNHISCTLLDILTLRVFIEVWNF